MAPKLPGLHVEGPDDQSAIGHLLNRHCVTSEKLPTLDIRRNEGDKGVLDMIPIAMKAAANSSVGFVLDIDFSLESRWDQIRGRLGEFRNLLPPRPVPGGTILDIPLYNARVGFWLMPANATEHGTLENLLHSLVPEGDSLFVYAEQASKAAKIEHGALYSDTHKLKAVLHCWLAWQKECGLPYGSAIKAKYFNHDSPEALAFVAWIRLLYNL